MVINISDTKVEKLIKDLDVALKDLKADGAPCVPPQNRISFL